MPAFPAPCLQRHAGEHASQADRAFADPSKHAICFSSSCSVMQESTASRGLKQLAALMAEGKVKAHIDK